MYIYWCSNWNMTLKKVIIEIFVRVYIYWCYIYWKLLLIFSKKKKKMEKWDYVQIETSEGVFWKKNQYFSNKRNRNREPPRREGREKRSDGGSGQKRTRGLGRALSRPHAPQLRLRHLRRRWCLPRRTRMPLALFHSWFGSLYHWFACFILWSIVVKI